MRVVSDDELITIMEINECRILNGMEPLPDLQERNCLKCGCKFLSSHKQNRLCDECFDENTEYGEYADLVGSFEDYPGTAARQTDEYIAEDFNDEDKPKRRPRYYTAQWERALSNDEPMRAGYYQNIVHNLIRTEDRFNLEPCGLVISNPVSLPGPCDIQPLPDDVLKIRTALSRKHLQCFEVREPLSDAQIAELDKGLEEHHSWILITNKHISPESFSNKVIVK